AGVSPDKISVIDNGIDVDAFRSTPSKIRPEFRESGMGVVGGVGRLVSQKGFDYLLRAVPRILERFPSTKFLIAGEGTERSRLEVLASELNISRHVQFLGARSDMP